MPEHQRYEPAFCAQECGGTFRKRTPVALPPPVSHYFTTAEALAISSSHCRRCPRRCHAKWNTANVLCVIRLTVVTDSEGVKHPMHAQIHAAGAVLLDHLPQAVWEVADVFWPHGSVVVLVHAIVFIGHKREILEPSVRIFIANSSAIEQTRHLKCRCAERGMPGGVGRKRRRKILGLARYCIWTTCKTGTSSWGCAANRKRSGIGNESTHCRSGTRRMT